MISPEEAARQLQQNKREWENPIRQNLQLVMPYVERELDKQIKQVIEKRENYVFFSSCYASSICWELPRKLGINPSDAEVQLAIIVIAAKIAKDAGYRIETSSGNVPYVKIFIPDIIEEHSQATYFLDAVDCCETPTPIKS